MYLVPRVVVFHTFNFNFKDLECITKFFTLNWVILEVTSSAIVQPTTGRESKLVNEFNSFKKLTRMNL